MGSPASEIQFSRPIGLPASDAMPASPNRQSMNRQTMPDIAQSVALGRTQKPIFRKVRSTSAASLRPAVPNGPAHQPSGQSARFARSSRTWHGRSIPADSAASRFPGIAQEHLTAVRAAADKVISIQADRSGAPAGKLRSTNRHNHKSTPAMPVTESAEALSGGSLQREDLAGGVPKVEHKQIDDQICAQEHDDPSGRRLEPV